MTKISCLTVTQASRLELLRQAVADFAEQTHANRELVIVHDDGLDFDDRLHALARSIYPLQVRTVQVPSGQKLGQLRNLSVDHAQGEVVCQWDDDDRHHPQRLSLQFDHLQKVEADACFLGDQLHWLMMDDEIHWVDWRTDSWPYDFVPGTLMAKRKRLPRYPEHMDKGEDTALCDALMQQDLSVHRIRDQGWCYIYRHHGRNCWGLDHHRAIVQSKAITPAKMLSRSRGLFQRLAEYRGLAEAGHAAFSLHGNCIKVTATKPALSVHRLTP